MTRPFVWGTLLVVLTARVVWRVHKKGSDQKFGEGGNSTS
jgi:hypothetical protein